MEVAIAIGGVFLTPLLQVGFERIASSRWFIEFFNGKKVMKCNEKSLDRLHRSLEKISVVLEDAEDKQKSTGVRTWLGKVKAEVNYADDLLDEFNTECLRLKLDYEMQQKQTIQQKESEVDPKAHHCCFLFRQQKSTHDYAYNTLFIEEFMPNLEKVTATLEDFANQIKELGLRESGPKENYPYRAPSSSVVDKSLMIFGRDDEKEKMIKMVLSDGGASDVSVIAITGLGGIGKTTLAQLVYNDDRVKKNFPTRGWVCVSEEYDDLRVTKTLLMEVNSAVVDDNDDVNRLQVKLRDHLTGKRFLIILDDVWNENYNKWSSLKTPLYYGGKGSKIIVTTRNENVALMMQNEPLHHMQPMHHMQPIPEEQSCYLFKSHAFGNGDHTSLEKFETIGKEIVNKCKGLPLAIKTVAGALRPKRDINVWHDFLNSKIWIAEGEILPALSLSYKHLPSHLKCCFAYCALFPKDVPFDKDEVVLLWMANDLVKPSTQNSTQKVGRHYFEELKSRSFFESVNEKKYIMHDLINDLARFVSRNSCIRLEDYEAGDFHQITQPEKEFPPELLHFSYLSTNDETFKRFSGLLQTQKLRTFLPIHQSRYQREIKTFIFSDIFPKFQRLRALNLSLYSISMVPDSIGDLKHLRFLNLASTNIKDLPNAISKCLNLQTLILANCEKLVGLPGDMRLLINLQHLDVRGTGDPFITNISSWLSIFEEIQNISVVVDKIQGSELELLVQLQLSHSLNIIGLGATDVVIIERAKSAGLIDKDCIESLSLEWSGNAKCSKVELNKFAQLQPHTNTKRLSIKGYIGTRFPDWLGDSAFSNMEFLSLEDCKNCFSLPPLGQLSRLKILYISDMDEIGEIGKEFYGDASTSKPFQALEKLKFSDMAEFAIWNTHSSVDFYSLKSLHIINCPKLVSDLPCGDSSEPIPLFTFSKLEEVYINGWDGLNLFKLPYGYRQPLTALQSLEIRNCNNIIYFPQGGLPAPNLKKLLVTNCKKIKSLPARMHRQLPLLTYLSIWGCPEIECFPEGGLPSSLQTLRIRSCKKMMICQTNWGLQRLQSLAEVHFERFDDTLFPEEGLLPSSLQELFIEHFRYLESLNPKGLQHLCSLRSLRIADCPNLQYLPQQNVAFSLSKIDICNCKHLMSFPEGLASSLTTLYVRDCPNLKARIDWAKVSQIPDIYIDPELIISDEEVSE